MTRASNVDLRGIDELRPHPTGELRVIQPDSIDDTFAFLRGFLTPGAGGRVINLDEALATPALSPVISEAPSHGPGIEIRDGSRGKGVYTLRALPKGEVILRGEAISLVRRIWRAALAVAIRESGA